MVFIMETNRQRRLFDLLISSHSSTVHPPIPTRCASYLTCCVLSHHSRVYPNTPTVHTQRSFNHRTECRHKVHFEVILSVSYLTVMMVSPNDGCSSSTGSTLQGYDLLRCETRCCTRHIHVFVLAILLKLKFLTYIYNRFPTQNTTDSATSATRVPPASTVFNVTGAKVFDVYIRQISHAKYNRFCYQRYESAAGKHCFYVT